MALDIGQLILAGGVGVADEMLRVKDAQAGRTEPLKRWMDYLRLGVTVGGLALQVWQPKYARWGQAAALAGMPLVVKSLNDSAQIIKGQASYSPRGGNFAPAPQASRPQPAPVASRYPAPTNQAEFHNIRLS